MKCLNIYIHQTSMGSVVLQSSVSYNMKLIQRKISFKYWNKLIDVMMLSYGTAGVLADGRCLFRAIAHGACLRNGEEAPDENHQRQLADELRTKVKINTFCSVDSLIFHS